MEAHDVLKIFSANKMDTPVLDNQDRNERTQPLVLVQVLRACAALLVLVGHSMGEVVHTAAAKGQIIARLPHLPGGFGVDLFFCISGFIMVVSSARLFGAPNARRDFLLRRAIRLVPLYWLVTLCYVPLLLLGSRGYQGSLLQALVTSLAFIPFPTYGAEGALVFPLYTLGWSLNYEVFFYLIFSLFIVMSASRAVTAVCATMLLLVATGLVLSPETTVLRFWSQPIILEFALGVLIGYFWLGRRNLSGLQAGLMIAGAMAFLLADPLGLTIKIEGVSTQNDLVRLMGWGLPAALILLAAVLFERQRKIDLKSFSFIAYLGDCSYSLYLVHPIALLFITKTWKILHLERIFAWEVLGVALIAGSIGLAIISYRYVEKPLTRWLHQKSFLAR